MLNKTFHPPNTRLYKLLLALTLLLFTFSAYAADETQTFLPPGEKPVKVGVGIYINDVNFVTELTSVIDVTVTLYSTWKDPRLKFKPIGNNNELVYTGVPAKDKIHQIWHPYLYLYTITQNYNEQSVILRINSDGVVKYIKTIEFGLDANIKSQRFPFDKQTFKLGVGSQIYNDTQVQFTKLVNNEGINPHITTPNWKIPNQFTSFITQNFSADLEAPVSTYMFTFNFDRQSITYILDVLAPLLILVALSYFLLYVKVDAGSLLQVTITLVLTMVAFQWLLFNIIPDVSYISFIEILILLSFAFTCLVVVAVGIFETAEKNYGLKSRKKLESFFKITLPILLLVSIAIAIWFFF